MKVRALMLRDLTSVDPSDSIRTLVEILESSETSSIPVTDEEDRLSVSCRNGMFSAQHFPSTWNCFTTRRSCRISTSLPAG